MIGRRRAKRNLFTNRSRQRRRRLALSLACAAAALLILLFGGQDPVPELEAGLAPPEAVVTEPKDLAALLVDAPHMAPQDREPEPPAQEVLEGAVQPGETASDLLGEYLSAADIHCLAQACRQVYPLARIQANGSYRISLEGGVFKGFEYEFSKDEKLVAAPANNGFDVRREAIVYETETALVEGTIDSSLFETVDAMGEHPSLAVRLSEIFAWDVDFVRDIRQGDSFRALVEKRFRKGVFAGYGAIAAARFVNQGQVFNGFLFQDADGRLAYYDENGRSLRKAFLKAPLAFRRISSGFSLCRLHPILNIRRPHPGIDYAAPTGTPVKTVGDGVVLAKGWDHGGGNYVKIRHNSVYETSYMHLSRFAKGLGKGARVHQGQVIGYVGATGLATGPHLDFRMKKNNSFVNPRTIKSPSAEPVAKARLAEFQDRMAPLMSALDRAEPVRMAQGAW